MILCKSSDTITQNLDHQGNESLFEDINWIAHTKKYKKHLKYIQESAFGKMFDESFSSKSLRE